VRRTREHAAAVRDIRRLGTVTGVPWTGLYGRARTLRRDRGFRYREALLAGLLDPACPWYERAASDRQAKHAEGLVNAAGAPMTEDKVVFAALAGASGLPVARRLAVLSRAGATWDWHHERPVPAGGWAECLDGMPDEVVVKPVHGYSGHGVRVLVRDGDAWRTVGDGGRITSAALAAELRADPEFGQWLVEERLRNHPEVARLGDPETLKTLRVTTLVGADGVPEVLWSVLRIAQAGPVDNIRSGTRATVCAWVDVADGRLLEAMAPRPDGLGLRVVDADPRTGVPLAGLGLPMWDEVVAVAHAAARVFLPMRSVGLDVAIGPDGPVVTEANAYSDVFPGFDGRTYIARLAREAALTGPRRTNPVVRS
jgi:hypothetical protein